MSETTAAPQSLENSMQSLVQLACSPVSRRDTLMYNNRYSAITNDRQLVTQLYLEHGIVQVVIDAPVDDAFRGGVDIVSEELDSDDIKTLQQYLETEGVLQSYAMAIKWARLFGGGGLIINAGQKFDKQFNIEMVREKGPLAFLAVDKWELGYMPQGNLIDQLTDPVGDVPYNYYGHRLHKSNVLRICGKEAPSLIRGQFQGWGVSELERLVRSFNSYLKHQSVVFELLDESKIDVFGIQGFNASLATKAGTEQTARRIQLATQLKSYQNALAIDKEDTYEQKQIAFSGLSDILNEIRKGIAADVRMPLTKLFGISSSGFNAGDDDLENYNAIVETDIRSKVRGGVVEVLRICCKKLFGFVPETLHFEYKPLRILNHKDESELKTQALNRAIAGYTSGLMTTEKVVEVVNSEKVFPIELNEAEALTLEELAEMKSAGDPAIETAPGDGGVKVLSNAGGGDWIIKKRGQNWALSTDGPRKLTDNIVMVRGFRSADIAEAHAKKYLDASAFEVGLMGDYTKREMQPQGFISVVWK